MNKHLKKVLSFTFVFILAFVLIACNNGASSADKEAVEAAKLDVTIGKIIGTNASKDEIKEDLVLPLKSGDVVVSWSSDKKEVITDAGKVVRPEEEDVIVTLTASFKLNDAEDTKTFDLKVLKAAGGTVNPDAKKVIEFNFTTTTLGTSYSSNNGATKTVQNVVDSKDVSVVVTRAAGNNNHSTHTDPFLVFSASTKDGNAPASFEIDLGFTPDSMTFDAVFWSDFDLEQTTKLEVQALRDEVWVTVLDFRTNVTAANYTEIEVTGINATKVRIYAEGTAPGGSGNNGARTLFDNVIFYGEGSTPVDPVDPVDPVEPEGTKVVEFNFTTTTLGYSYSSNNEAAKTIQNVVDNAKINVISTRTTSNNNHGTYKDPFLVMSASTKEGTAPAIIEIDLGVEVDEVVFEAAYWSSFDADQTTKLELQAFRNGEWVVVSDLKVLLAGAVEYTTINIKNLDTTKVRIYAEGTAPSGSGNNGARTIFDNMKFYSN